MLAQIKRHNASGLAVTMDDLMPAGGKRAKPRGKGRWKAWLPEAVAKAAFAPPHVLARITAQEMKRSHRQVLDSKQYVSKTIKDQQSKLVKNLRSLSEQTPLRYWITNTVFDETQLEFKLRKRRAPKKYSTVASHSQVTWGDDDGEHDMDLHRAPTAIANKNAASMFSCVVEDPASGVCPTEEARPRARFYGSLTSTDSDLVNHLTLKRVREVLPATVLQLPCFCVQHRTNAAVDALTERTKLRGDLYCASKVLEDGQLWTALAAQVETLTEEMEIVDPATFELEPGDCGESFSTKMLDECYLSGGASVDDPPGLEEDKSSAKRQIAAEFRRFFPYGWNRRTRDITNYPHTNDYTFWDPADPFRGCPGFQKVGRLCQSFGNS